jgi:hypothetical protein
VVRVAHFKNHWYNTPLRKQSMLVVVFITHSYTTGLTSDRIIVEYTREVYCDMGLTLGACESRTGTDVGEYVLHYPWSAFSSR